MFGVLVFWLRCGCGCLVFCDVADPPKTPPRVELQDLYRFLSGGGAQTHGSKCCGGGAERVVPREWSCSHSLPVFQYSRHHSRSSSFVAGAVLCRQELLLII